MSSTKKLPCGSAALLAATAGWFALTVLPTPRPASADSDEISYGVDYTTGRSTIPVATTFRNFTPADAGGHPDFGLEASGGEGRYMLIASDALTSDLVPAFRSSGSLVLSDWQDALARNIASPRSHIGSMAGDVAGSVDGSPGGAVSSSTSFAQWYRTISGVNTEQRTVESIARQGDGTYVLDRSLDDFGGFADHDYTCEMRVLFVHEDAQNAYLTVETGAEAWVYVDDKLVIDGGAGLGAGIAAPLPTVLLVTPDAASPQALDAERKSLLESWGYTVVYLDQDESQASYDAALAGADVVWVSERCGSSAVGNKLNATSKGVINEEGYLNDVMQFSSDDGRSYTLSQINVTDTSHEISQPLSTGVMNLTTTPTWLRNHEGTMAPGVQVLARDVGNNTPMLAAVEAGATLADGSTAAGRRVMLPFGGTISGSSFSITELTAEGEIILQRALVWAGVAGGGGGGGGPIQPPSMAQTIDFNRLGWLRDRRPYTIRVFFANRTGVASNLRVETNIQTLNAINLPLSIAVD